MSGKQFWIAILAVVTLVVAVASAQEEKNEISGVVGRSFISTQPFPAAACGGCFDPNIRFDRGITIEASYARRYWVAPIYAERLQCVLCCSWGARKPVPHHGRVLVGQLRRWV